MQPQHVKAASRHLLTTEQVADALAVTPQTVRRWILRGELTAVKVRHQWRIRTDQLERVLVCHRDVGAER